MTWLAILIRKSFRNSICNFFKSVFQSRYLPGNFMNSLKHLFQKWSWEAASFSRSSRPEVFWKKSVLRKFTGKHLCQSLFFNKVETLAQVFSCEFCQISKNIFLHRTRLVAASVSLSFWAFFINFNKLLTL